MVWDARPARLASSEVQHVLSLEGLSRRFQRVLRADPLRLRLDFSDTRLAKRHLAWLALPSWKDRVEALTLYNWPAPASEERSRNFLDPSLCTHGDVVSPLLAVLRASQRASLRQLLGMPLSLDGVPERLPDNVDVDSEVDSSAPLVDLSMFLVTELGVPSGTCDCFVYGNLPQTLVTLLCRGSYACNFAGHWVPCPAALAAARLPSLSNVHLFDSNLVVSTSECFPALTGWHAAIETDRFVLQFNSDLVDMPGSLFPGAREVRIDTRRMEIQHNDDEGDLMDVDVAEAAEAIVDAIADMLCPPCLERMEIKSGSEFPCIWILENGDTPLANRRVWQWVMGKLIRAHMSQFAFEVHDGLQKEVAWRRLPAPGTPEHDAASALTAKALEWASA